MNFRTGLLFAVLLLQFQIGCSIAGKRLFQAKVPGPVVKTEQQIEAEKRSADLIARKIETPAELKPVAEALSTSLGKPAKPIPSITPADLPKAAATSSNELQGVIAKQQQQIAALNKNLSKYQGMEIEGTGFSVLGPSTIIILVGLIALGIFCPGALTLMFFAFKRLKATAGIVVDEVEKAAKSPETQAAVAKIKAGVASRLDTLPAKLAALHKKVIVDLKKLKPQASA